MWYAVDVDHGIIGEFDTLRDAVIHYSDNGKSKRLSRGVYEVTSRSDSYNNTTYIINSRAIGSANIHGFGWVFDLANKP